MNQDEELHSFPYEANIGGTHHYYRITQNEEKYGIEQDGVVIAKVEHGEHWRQLSGKPLPKELLDSICNYIESHYE